MVWEEAEAWVDTEAEARVGVPAEVGIGIDKWLESIVVNRKR